jgi:hypothetical protein
VVALARGAGPVSGVGVGADEAGDDGAEPFAGVFLQEVAGAGDHRVVDAGRAGQATSVPALPQLSSAARHCQQPGRASRRPAAYIVVLGSARSTLLTAAALAGAY